MEIKIQKVALYIFIKNSLQLENNLNVQYLC